VAGIDRAALVSSHRGVLAHLGIALGTHAATHVLIDQGVDRQLQVLKQESTRRNNLLCYTNRQRRLTSYQQQQQRRSVHAKAVAAKAAGESPY
jgi:hypothetical protein